MTTNETWEYLATRCTLQKLEGEVEELLREESLFKKGPYLYLEPDVDWGHRRNQRKTNALRVLSSVSVYVRTIASFPFVRGVAISGSLSKFSVGPGADIDYFIITDRNKLWITRTLLHLFKKLTFLVNKQHAFCMNYFVDTEGLTLNYRSEFTAIELATLIPVYNFQELEKLKQKNDWLEAFLPNHPLKYSREYLMPSKSNKLKAFFEYVLSLCFPDKMNRFLMWLTDKKWRNKFRHLNLSEEDYKRAFYTTLHVSKNHPYDYSRQVARAMEETEASYSLV